MKTFLKSWLLLTLITCSSSFLLSCSSTGSESSTASTSPLLDVESIVLKKKLCGCIEDKICNNCNTLLSDLFDKAFKELQLRNPLWKIDDSTAKFQAAVIPERRIARKAVVITTMKITIVSKETGAALPCGNMELVRTRTCNKEKSSEYYSFNFTFIVAQKGVYKKTSDFFKFASSDKGFTKTYIYREYASPKPLA